MLLALLSTLVMTAPRGAQHALTPLRTTAVAAPAATPGPFTFVLAGDNRSSGRGIPMPPTATEIFRESQILGPAFILWTGDTIYGCDESIPEARAEYATFLESARLAHVPVYNAPGNHEIFDRKELETLYTQEMGPLYGSFDYGASHFIALDTEEVGAKPGIGSAQLAWLEQDLQAHSGSQTIFAFTHHPLFPKDPTSGFADEANRDAVHALFVKYGVKNVFSGHEHLFFKSEHDGVTYWVTGGAGAPSEAGADDGGYQHYLLFTVDAASVSAILLEPWRLFSNKYASPGLSGVQVSNYNRADLPVTVDVPVHGAIAETTVKATWEYKGKVHSLPVTLLAPRTKGVVTVRLAVPGSRTATIAIPAH